MVHGGANRRPDPRSTQNNATWSPVPPTTGDTAHSDVQPGLSRSSQPHHPPATRKRSARGAQSRPPPATRRTATCSQLPPRETRAAGEHHRRSIHLPKRASRHARSAAARAAHHPRRAPYARNRPASAKRRAPAAKPWRAADPQIPVPRSQKQGSGGSGRRKLAQPGFASQIATQRLVIQENQAREPFAPSKSIVVSPSRCAQRTATPQAPTSRTATQHARHDRPLRVVGL